MRILLSFVFVAFSIFNSAFAWNPEIYDSVSLDGAWEMKYLPYVWETRNLPEFTGVKVAQAVPGYWEDMVGAFRAAGMKDEFRIHPWHIDNDKRVYPLCGWVPNLTMPNLYGTFLYRRTLQLDRVGDAVLAFEGVRNQVYIWVNGRFIGERQGFSTPFERKIPQGILHQGANEIILAVSNCSVRGYNNGYMSGMMTRGPAMGTGGVSGHLELRFPRNDLSEVHVRTAADLKTFTVHVSGKTAYTYVIRDGERECAKGGGKGNLTLSTDGYTFWSPENPKQYTLELKTAQGSCTKRFGIRRLVADGPKLRLNGRLVYLRGVTDHCYFPTTVRPPRDYDYYRKLNERRRELGFNLIRFHTYIPCEEYLRAADDVGIMVHIETPNFVTENEFASIIRFARPHPSVVIYCMGNETRIDRLAEAYMSDIASMVHQRTDSLFSPMSALRGVEYALIGGLDPIVAKPFHHNAQRLKRLAGYCDLFNSYQQGATSYNSLNGASSAALDAWAGAYCGKPVLSHEICIDGSFIDLAVEREYPANSPILKAGVFSRVRDHLAAKGVLDRAPEYARCSAEWMRRIRKFTFEKLRAADRVSGYDFLGDMNTQHYTFGYHCGIMDEFLRFKPGESVENVRRYNSAAVLLADLGSDFNVVAGAKKRVAISISNFDVDVLGAKLTLELRDVEGKVRWQETREVGDIASGKLSALGAFDVPIPDGVAKYELYAVLSREGRAPSRPPTAGDVPVSNLWELHAFPKTSESAAPAGVRVVNAISRADLLAAMAKGESVVLFGAGPFKSSPTTYRIGLAGRTSGNFATVIRRGHPIFKAFPHEGFCGWQFRRLMEGGRAVQLEAGVPFDPIVDVAPSEKHFIRQSALFEYRVGKGKLLVCTFNFTAKDPAAAYLKRQILDYAGSGEFNPAQELSLAQLQAVIDEPLDNSANVTNPNQALDAGDPTGEIRANGPFGEFARP